MGMSDSKLGMGVGSPASLHFREVLWPGATLSRSKVKPELLLHLSPFPELNLVLQFLPNSINRSNSKVKHCQVILVYCSYPFIHTQNTHWNHFLTSPSSGIPIIWNGKCQIYKEIYLYIAKLYQVLSLSPSFFPILPFFFYLFFFLPSMRKTKNSLKVLGKL